MSSRLWDGSKRRAPMSGWTAGWGVDALVGEQTREHKDLDLIVRDSHESRMREALATDDPSLALRGLTYKDLLDGHPKVAAKFENFNLTVMSVLTDEESKINDLFIRLNTSRPLTAPEYRNAMKGVVPPLIRELADHRFFTECISFKTNRGEDQQVAAKFTSGGVPWRTRRHEGGA